MCEEDQQGPETPPAETEGLPPPGEAARIPGPVRRWAAVGWLASIHVLLGLWGMLWMHDEVVDESDLSGMFVISLAMSQGSLLGIWAALGGRGWPWRFVPSVLAIYVAMWSFELVLPDSDGKYWTYFLMVQTIATALPLLVLRLTGLRLVRRLPDGAAGPLEPVQFSILRLLEWTTALAILLGLLPATPDEFRTVFNDTEGLWFIFGLFGADAFLAVAGLWVALGVRWTAGRASVLVVAVVAFFIIISILPSAGPDEFWLLPPFCAAWVVGSLWVVRASGYRLAWRGVIRL